MTHNAQAIVLSCIDFRFRKALQDFLEKELHLTAFDIKSDAGGVQQIIKGGPVADWILENFEMASSLHGVNRIILVNHEDCGAYGGSRAFRSVQDERAHLIEQLKEGAKIVSNKFGAKQVEAYLAVLTDPITFAKVV